MRKTRDGVSIDLRLGDASQRTANAAALAKLARSGVIVEYVPQDALGWIELDGGRERIRFGASSCSHFRPEVGTAVRVLSVGAGFRGVPRAMRVVRTDHSEAPALQSIEILRALWLPTELARARWPETHAALVDAYLPASGARAIDRTRALASRDDTVDQRGVQAALSRWLGEPINAEDPIGHAADILLIRDEHGSQPGTGPQLFEIRGATGRLYAMRTWAERLAIPGGEQLDIATLFHPDTDAALSGIFRVDGLQPAFAAHAPRCATCKQNLRDVARDDPASLPSEFQTLLR